MGTNTKQLAILDLRGGQNDADPPMLLPENQVVSAVNVDYWRGGLCRKRGGSAAVGVTFTSGGPFAETIGSLITHNPNADETSSELWALDNNGVMGRLAGAATWVAVTLGDAIVATGRFANGVSFDGKLYVAYRNAGGNRLHLWDGTTFRKVGMTTPAAPTAANDAGAGTYAAVVRYYKVSYIELSGSTIVRRSELSPSVSITPHGDHTKIVVTKPATVSGGETHWEIWGSADNLVYYNLNAVAVATSTYDDTAAPSSYSSGTVAPIVNDNLPPPSCKYLVTDGNRLVMSGCWETSGGYVTPKKSRVWWTPVLGASDIGDGERVPLDHYLDVNDNDGSVITGLAAFDNCIYVFKFRSVFKLVPTGNAAAPYQLVNVSRSIGALSQQCIVSADDEAGNPSLYFMSTRGPQRIGVGGLQYLGHDNETLWGTCLDAVAKYPDAAFAVAYLDRHQVWFWVPSSTSDPNTKVLLVYDTAMGRVGPMGIRGGWTQHTGMLTNAWCGTSFASSVGSSMTVTRLPYVGHGATAGLILKTDTGTQDVTTSFQGNLTTKAYALGGIGRNFGMGAGTLLARSSAGTTITVTASRDYGVETRTATTALTATGSETSVIRKLEGMDGAGLSTVQFTIGDAAASSAAWTVDALIVPYDIEEPR